jgi:succinoglycan biosynthesis transport protein ExoP
MPHLDDNATLGDYWNTLRRRRRLVAVCGGVGLALAAVWTFVAPSHYSARASVVIAPIQSDPFASTRIEDVGASTEVNVLASTVVAARAAERLHQTDPLELVHHLTVDNPPETLVLDLTYTDADAGAARDGAQAFAQAYLDYRQEGAEAVKARKLAQVDAQLTAMHTELDKTIDAINSSGLDVAARSSAEARRGVVSSRIGDLEVSRSELNALDTTPGEVIRPAELPGAPDGPGRTLTLAGGAALGLLAGVAIALVRDRSDKRLLGHRDLVDLLDDEPLAELPPAVLPLGPAQAASGEYRRLRARVWPDRTSGPHRVLVVAPSAAEPADEVAAGLALTIAATGWSVVLTWLDRTSLPGWVGAEADVLARSLDPDVELAQRLVEPKEHPGLALLPALGRGDGAGAVEVAESHLAMMDDFVEVQLIVGEPVLASAEAVEVAPMVDGVIVAFDVRRTDRAELARALETLGTSGKLLGVVGTSVPARW